MDKNGRFLLFFLLAGIVGLINGLFGGGGGMLCVPIFKKMLALPDKKAHATTIAAISLISFPTLCIYLCTLDYSWQNIILVTIGTLFGGVVGSLLLNKISDKLLNFLFIVVLVFSGIKMLF